jgi:hypothetical protein
MTDEQPLDVALCGKLARKLALDDISLVSMSAKMVGAVRELEPGYEVSKPEVLWDIVDGQLVGLFSLMVSIYSLGETKEDGSRDKTPLARIDLSFRASYRFLRSYNHEEDEQYVKHFAGINGLLHVWPYFRSDVQALSTRLGFPPILLKLGKASAFAQASVQRRSPGSHSNKALAAASTPKDGSKVG